MAAVTPQEKQYYDQLFDAASSEDVSPKYVLLC